MTLVPIPTPRIVCTRADATAPWHTRAESWLGAFFTTVIGIGVAGFAPAMYSLMPPTLGNRVLLWGMMCCSVLFSPPFLWYIWTNTWRGAHPAAPIAAMRHWRWPIPLNFVAAAWWLGHFAFGVFGAVYMELHPREIGDDAAIFIHAIAALMVLFYTCAANGFLITAVASVTRRPGAVIAVWKWRFLTDLLITAIALFVAMAMRPHRS